MKTLLLTLGIVALVEAGCTTARESEVRSYMISRSGSVIPNSGAPYVLEVREGYVKQLKEDTPATQVANARRNRPSLLAISSRLNELRVMDTVRAPHGDRSFYVPGSLLQGRHLQVCLVQIGDRPNPEGEYVILLLDPNAERKPNGGQSLEGCGPWMHRIDAREHRWETVAAEAHTPATHSSRGPYVVQIRLNMGGVR
jgi:hypothetical protein